MDHRISGIDTAEHYTWGGVCDGWHLLKDPTLSVIQERVPPGAGEGASGRRSSRRLGSIWNWARSIAYWVPT